MEAGREGGGGGRDGGREEESGRQGSYRKSTMYIVHVTVHVALLMVTLRVEIRQ